MKFSLRRDLGLQLLTLYLLFVGPVVAASLLFDQFASRRIQADVKAADLALAQAIAQETETVLKNSLLTVQQLAAYPGVIESDPGRMEPLFEILMIARPDINLIYRLDDRGTMVYHYPTGPGSTVGWDFSHREYYQRARLTRLPLISEGRISPTTGQPVATAVMPLWDEAGRFTGLVATNIKLESLSTTLASIAAEHRPEEAFDVAIVDRAGRIIAHPTTAFLLTDSRQLMPGVVDAVLSSQTGNVVESGRDDQEMLFSYVPIPSPGWGVIVSRPTASAFTTARATHRTILITVTVFLVIGFFIWIALSRRVIQPLERLAAFSQRIGLNEDISHLERDELDKLSARSDQIGRLIRSLSRMQGSIEARLNELSTLLQTSAAVVSSLDSHTVLDRILEQVERLMDIQRSAIIALDEEQGVFRARASRGLSQRYVEHLEIDPQEPSSVTLRAVRSGEPIQISDTEADPTYGPFRPRSRSEGYRSILAVPLNTQHTPPSALLVYRPDPHVFSVREINLLTSFANHAAMAIENAALYANSDLRLREQTRRLEALIHSLQDGLVLEDLQGNVLYANRKISELLNLPNQDVLGAPVNLLIDRILALADQADPGSREKNRRAIQAVRQGQGERRVEIAIQVDRQMRFLRLHLFEVTDLDELPIGRGMILRDITQNKEIDRMKSSLISTVSHELRTPLAAIKGYASTLLADDVQWDAAAQQEFLSIISAETDRLSDLVNDLLDMSKIEAGNLSLTRVECSLDELISRASLRAHPRPDYRLQVDLPPDLPALLVDQQRVEAILRNLIENAVKYAGDESPVTVRAAVHGDSVIVQVEDEGPGIPPEHIPHIFNSFYRIENGLTRATAGAGLGLAICKGFVNAHGGDIWFEPRRKGTCVAFSLPLSRKLDPVTF